LLRKVAGSVPSQLPVVLPRMPSISCDPKDPAFIIYNIPCCGGWCAPTVNPDPTCGKHFSNEFTVPAAGLFMDKAPWCEHSKLCLFCGKCGFSVLDNHRKKVMFFGGWLNIVSMILAVVSCVGGLSDSSDALKAAPWVRGKGNLCNTENGKETCIEVQTYMGITARYDSIDLDDLDSEDREIFSVFVGTQQFTLEEGNKYSRTLLWTDEAMCTNAGNETNQMCQDCKDNNMATSTLLIGVFAQFPTVVTNCQRGTPFGDVNCQASMGVISNVVGFASSMGAWQAYEQACYAVLPTSVNGQDFEWK